MNPVILWDVTLCTPVVSDLSEISTAYTRIYRAEEILLER